MKKINEYVERSLMLVTALSPVIGYDKASKIAHYADDNDLTLKEAALKLGFVTEAEFDRVVGAHRHQPRGERVARLLDRLGILAACRAVLGTLEAVSSPAATGHDHERGA